MITRTYLINEVDVKIWNARSVTHIFQTPGSTKYEFSLVFPLIIEPETKQ